MCAVSVHALIARFPGISEIRDRCGGAGWLFSVLLEGAEGYCAYAGANYDVEIDIEAVHHVYALRPLTARIIARLNPGVDASGLVDELRTLGLAVP